MEHTSHDTVLATARPTGHDRAWQRRGRVCHATEGKFLCVIQLHLRVCNDVVGVLAIFAVRQPRYGDVQRLSRSVVLRARPGAPL